MSHESANRREFTRVHFPLAAEIALSPVATVTVAVEDISLNGARVRSQLPLPTGAVRVRISLPGGDPACTVTATAEVVRNEAGGTAAIHFRELVGDESLTHLRRLVLYNAENTASVEEEFATHLGLNPRPSV